MSMLIVDISLYSIWRLNEGGEISSGEHCFISDHDIVKKKFCLNPQGQWNPVGEWQWDNVIFLPKIRRLHLYVFFCLLVDPTNS